jgi:hypothetical protein
MKLSFKLKKKLAIKKWDKCKKRLKIESKRVSKAENFIEGKQFFEGWPTRSSKKGSNIVFNKIVQPYRVFMYERKFYTEKSNLKKLGYQAGGLQKIAKVSKNCKHRW